MLSTAVIFWTGLLVLLGLWMLGAYNRITALRAPILAAWVQVEQALTARGQALAAMLAAAAEPLASETAALDAVAATQAQVLASTEVLRRRPVAPDLVAELSKADAVLAAVLVRVVALVEQQGALLAEEAVQAPLKVLRELPPRLAFARQTFNDAGRTYNAAIEQFPTRLLTSVFGFGHAGRL